MATIVNSVKDLDGITVGDQIIIEPVGFDAPDHDPEAFAEASIKLNAEVSKALTKQLATDQDEPKKTNNGNGSTNSRANR